MTLPDGIQVRPLAQQLEAGLTVSPSWSGAWQVLVATAEELQVLEPAGL